MPTSPARPIRRVVFDVDSTLSAIEGIDELARLRGIDVSRMTARAMRGEERLENVYGRRLERVRPTVRMISLVAALYVEHRLAGAERFIRDLYKHGIEAWIVSGAIRATIMPLARSLGIPGHRVFGVDLYFDTNGRYAGFDSSSPLTRGEGKRIVLTEIRDPAKFTVLVGDGATDLAAAPAVDVFVAFTGAVERPAVAAASKYVANSFVSLRKILGLRTAATNKIATRR